MAQFPNITNASFIWNMQEVERANQGQNWPVTINAIFGFGYTSSALNIITRFDNTGTYVGSEYNAGTARNALAAASYGGDKAIFGFGVSGTTNLNTITKFDNTGTFVSPETTAGTARNALAAASYGGDKAIFGFGDVGSNVNTITRFNNIGTYVGSEETAGTARNALAAASCG